jgi:succinate-semialdehyde dehydrogenase/glutarate-semialdehyde dehydrogenase
MKEHDRFESRNPCDGSVVESFPLTEAEEVEERLQMAVDAFERFRTTRLEQRAIWLRRAADLLERGSTTFSRLMTLEVGKPILASKAEVEKCAWVCRYYADHGADFLAASPIDTTASRSLVLYQPLGPVLAIMPWNFPFWQVFRFAAPALMAGNVALLKHAPNVPGCAIAIENVMKGAGFPAGVFQNLFVDAERVADLLADPRIAAATLTGSVRAGRAVASEAGRHIKKTVLELGGSDPYIVMPSADIEKAAATAVVARTLNNGQTCIAAKRIIVAEEVADEFETRFVAGMEALVVGDPMDETVDVGPLARAAILEEVDRQVRESIEAGASLLTGGARLDGPGYFYPPTVLSGVPAGAPACTEEVFGPVAALFRVPDVDRAIALANDTRFGLGASAWTMEPEEQERLARELEAGTVFINAMVASDPRLPFGGIKQSGYGRELGAEGIREFVNVKSIWVS